MIFGWQYNIFILVNLWCQLHCASAISKCFMVSIFVCGEDKESLKCRSEMFAIVGSCRVPSQLVCASMVHSGGLSLDTKAQ